MKQYGFSFAATVVIAAASFALPTRSFGQDTLAVRVANDGLVAWAAGDSLKAEALLAQASAIAPENASVVGNYGIVLRARGKGDIAIPFLTKAVQVEPEVAVWRTILGYSLYDAKKWAEAAQMLESADRIEPGTDRHVLIGAAYARLQKMPECVSHIQVYVAATKNDGNAWSWLGYCLFEEKRFEEAAVASRNALDNGSVDANDASRLGLSLYNLNRDQEAIVALRKAVELAPTEQAFATNLNLAVAGNLQRIAAAAAQPTATTASTSGSSSSEGAEAGVAGPLDLDDTIALVKQSLSDDLKRNFIWDECRAFEVDAAAESKLRSAGASGQLINDIKSACFLQITKDRVLSLPSGIDVLANEAQARGFYTALAKTSYRHFKVVSSYTTSSTVYTTEYFNKRPNKRVSQMTESSSTGDTYSIGGFDGSTAWGSGTARSIYETAIVSGESATPFRTGADFDLLFDRTLSHVTSAMTLSESSVDVAGRTVKCTLVAVVRDNTATRECYDSSSGFLVRAEGTGVEGTPFTTTYESYQTVDGIVYPERVRTTDRVGSVTTVWSDVSHAELPDSIFQYRRSYAPLNRTHFNIGITETTGTLPTRNSVHEYAIQYTPGARLEVEVESKTLAPFIHVLSYDSGLFTPQGTAGEYKIGSKAKYVGTTDEKGFLIVRLFSSEGSGAYKIKVKKK